MMMVIQRNNSADRCRDMDGGVRNRDSESGASNRFPDNESGSGCASLCRRRG